jgi:2-polyprenyl-3-methyl-5-hydroxy-6-metoxy-1,4-benzoquinol methylase
VYVLCAYFEDFIAEMRYDHIVMEFILEHIDDPGRILRCYRDFFAPQGSLFSWGQC